MSVRLPWGIVRIHVADVTAADIMCSGGEFPRLHMTISSDFPRTDATPGDRYVFGCEVTTVQIVPRTSSYPGVIGAVKLGCRTVRGFPQINSAADDCGAVELNFRRASFPPDESVTIYGWPRWLARQCALER